MPYNLTLTNGTVLETLADGSADPSTTSINLIGKNFAGYGIYLNENFIKLLEHFANSTAPANPLKGQLWWDTGNLSLKIWNGSIWKAVGGSVANSSPPTNALAGDLWFNSGNGVLNVYSGSDWITIGPATPPGTALTGVLGNNLTDNASGLHTVGNVVVNNKLAGIVSTEANPFTLPTPVAGFTTINPGFNIANNVVVSGNITAQNIVISGNATLNGQAIATTSGGGTATFAALNNTPIGNATPSTGVFTTLSATTSLAVTGSLTLNGVPVATASGGAINGTPIGNVAPSTGAFTTLSASGATALNTATGASFQGIIGNVSPKPAYFTTVSVSGAITPASNAAIDLGSTSNWFNNVYGTSMHAKYADLAERFEADQPYSAGTVVELGGPAEIMAAGEDLSENVFGVISTNAAYLMNSTAGTDSTHPPVAVQGRVPVRVVGKIRKGDRLVSAGNGLARAGARSEITTWNVIGRALEDKLDTAEGTIEAVVKLNS